MRTYIALYVLDALVGIGVLALVLAGLRFSQIAGQGGFGAFVRGQGLKLLLGEREARDRTLSLLLAIARFSLIATIPVTFITAYLTAHG